MTNFVEFRDKTKDIAFRKWPWVYPNDSKYSPCPWKLWRIYTVLRRGII